MKASAIWAKHLRALQAVQLVLDMARRYCVGRQQYGSADTIDAANAKIDEQWRAWALCTLRSP